MSSRLRQIRELDCATLAQAAESFDVPASTYAAIERGARPATLDVSTIGYSLGRIEQVVDMSPPLHRQRSAVRAKTQRANQELVRLAGELFSELRATEPRSPSVGLRRLGDPATDDDIEMLAEECRYLLDLAPGEPIANLTSAVERAGVCLVPVHDDGTEVRHSVDGLSAWVEEQPTIAINPRRPGDRFRLTLAHELGHLIMHRRPGDDLERQANLLGSCLLVPTDSFVEALGDAPSLREFVALKRTWGLSIAAGIYRARSLGILDSDRHRSLQMQTARWRKSEPASFPPRHGRLFTKLIDTRGGSEAVGAELGIAARHVAMLVAWDPRPVLRVLDGERDQRRPIRRRAQLSSIRRVEL